MADTKSSYPPILPIDMGQLDAITEGKSTFQAELLEMFFFNVSECIDIMASNCNDGECKKWKDATEELQNISNSLGALELSKSCAVAQKIYNAKAEEKKKMLANIRSNVYKLHVFIKNTRH